MAGVKRLSPSSFPQVRPPEAPAADRGSLRRGYFDGEEGGRFDAIGVTSIWQIMRWLVLFLLLASCSAYRDQAVPLRVEPVEAAALAGTWIEVARFPNVFERGCGASTATYTPQPDGQIGVLNTCTEPGGEVRSAAGTARVAAPGMLEVSFAPRLPGSWADYLVLSLDRDVLVTASPGGGLAWILARRPDPAPEAVENALSVLEANGYRTALLERFDTPSLRP